MQYRFVCHLSVAEFGHSLLIFNHPRVITSFFPPSNFGSEPRFVKNCAKWQFLKRRIEPKKRTFQIPHLGSICSIRFVCHLSVAEFGHSLLIFNHLFGRTGIFPFWILGGYEPRLAQDLKRRIEPQKTNLPNPPSWGLYAIYGLCAISCHHPFPEVCIPMSVIRCMWGIWVDNRHKHCKSWDPPSLSHTNIKSVCHLSVAHNIFVTGSIPVPSRNVFYQVRWHIVTVSLVPSSRYPLYIP